VTLLDAYALVALVADEPAAEDVEQLLRDGSPARVVTVNLAEAIDISDRVHEIPVGEIRESLEPLFLVRTLTGVPSGEDEAWLAAGLRAKHYDRKSCPLSLADCFLLAHALASGDDIATSDPPLAGVARTEGVSVVGLPDSAGRRP
jgi:uncharacterized protein with PIN domain